MDTKQTFDQILDNLDDVIKQKTPLGVLLWQEYLKVHPADIAQFLGNIERSTAKSLFLLLPRNIKLKVFSYLSDSMKVFCLSLLPTQDRSYFLSTLPIDELTDLFDDLSDEELKKYLKLLHKKDREKVISLLKFDPESAGGIMHTDVLTLMQDFTIDKSIKILQRLRPTVELHRIIYVTNRENELVGNIHLEDLLLKDPKTRLSSILRENILVALVDEDREKVAHDMMRYKLSTIPVVSENNIFLGVIDQDALVDIIEQEAAEDVYKISGVHPIRYAYFDTSFFTLFYQRGSILAILLLLQTFSTWIIDYYYILLAGFLIKFISMIASTGGNTSSQTSALVIQGILSGEITDNNMIRFLKREFLMALAIGATLGIISFGRIYLTGIIAFGWIYITHPGDLLSNFAVSVSLGVIVLVSVMLGSIIPLLLNKLNLDPALSAGPFLATIMDILGILIYCYVSRIILSF